MISPDLSIGEEAFLTMLTRCAAILCFTRNRDYPKINLPESAASVVIRLERDGALLAQAGWR
jgi:hypothetical protein